MPLRATAACDRCARLFTAALAFSPVAPASFFAFFPALMPRLLRTLHSRFLLRS
jgi:hypothetical protein